MSATENRTAKLAADRGRIPPSKLAHVVRRTTRFTEMVAWYETVLAAKVVHSNGMLAFLTYDDEHHRVAIAAFPGLAEAPKEMCAGTDHVAFNHADLGDLLHTWARLKQEGIEPYWCINHGLTTSMYYRDPDGNGIEFQVDNFPTLEEGSRWMGSAAFAANPVGVVFDPAELLERYRGGEPIESLCAQPPLPEGKSPFDMLRP
jgi:catechol 2,3-dioxygenase-like lactoylglutathione lyase family enzyme